VTEKLNRPINSPRFPAIFSNFLLHILLSLLSHPERISLSSANTNLSYNMAAIEFKRKEAGRVDVFLVQLQREAGEPQAAPWPIGTSLSLRYGSPACSSFLLTILCRATTMGFCSSQPLWATKHCMDANCSVNYSKCFSEISG
jgi:hypothetical protein